MSTVASRKDKARRLQYRVRDDLRALGKEFGLDDDDIRSTPMGSTGVDTWLSPAALRLFPFAIECKNQESLNVTREFVNHFAKYKKRKTLKLLVHSRNRSDTLVTMRWSTFVNLFGVYLDLKGEVK